MINYTKHQIYREDIREVVKVLKSDSLTQGKKVNEFEIKLKKKFKSKFCNVVSNGTAALHLAGMALGWTSKDIIITTPLTFLASANAILYSGARPDFVDINSRDFNIDLNILEEKIKKLKHKQKIKSVIALDYAGQPCDWEGLQYLSKKFSFSLINDNCHALGSKYYNDPGYAVKYADIVTHSYHATKNISSCEGGYLLTNNKDIYESNVYGYDNNPITIFLSKILIQNLHPDPKKGYNIYDTIQKYNKIMLNNDKIVSNFEWWKFIW